MSNIFTTALNPVWLDPEHTHLQLRVYYANSSVHDVQIYGQYENYPGELELWAAAMNGDFGPIGDYIPPVPEVVTAAQGRIALVRAGLLTQVQALIDLSDQEVKIWFEYAHDWHRNNQVINNLATAMNLTQDQLDGLFRTAATI